MAGTYPKWRDYDDRIPERVSGDFYGEFMSQPYGYGASRLDAAEAAKRRESRRLAGIAIEKTLNLVCRMSPALPLLRTGGSPDERYPVAYGGLNLGWSSAERLEGLIHASNFCRVGEPDHRSYSEAVRKMIAGWDDELGSRLLCHLENQAGVARVEKMPELSELVADIATSRAAKAVSIVGAVTSTMPGGVIAAPVVDDPAQDLPEGFEELVLQGLGDSARGSW